MVRDCGDCDLLWLLERIKLESSGLDIKGNKRVNFFVLILRLFNFKQSKKMSNDEYYNQFMEHVSSLELAGGKGLFCNPVSPCAFSLKLSSLSHSMLVRIFPTSQCERFSSQTEPSLLCS